MANNMDVDSSTNALKPLSGSSSELLPLTTGANPAASITLGRDPRRASAARHSVDPSPSAQLPPKQPLKSPGPATSSNLSPQIASLPTPNTAASGPKPTENQTPPKQTKPASISDLVDSLIKANKDEDEKVRLEKEKVSLTKHLQRAQQFPHFASAAASYHAQLDIVKDKLANHTNRLHKNLARSAQAEININAMLTQPKAHPKLDQMPGRIQKLEFEISELKKSHVTSVTNDSSEQLRRALQDIENFKQTTQSSDQDLNEFRGKLKGIEYSLEGCIERYDVLDKSMAHMKRIASSVDYQDKRDGALKSRITQLEVDMNAAGTVEEKLPIFEKMVQNLDDNLKVANEELDDKIVALKDRIQISDKQLGKRLAEIEDNLKKLRPDREGLVDERTTDVAQIGTDLDVQKQQLDEQIVTWENHLNTLFRTRDQNLTNGGLVLAQAQMPITQGQMEPRFTALEQRVNNHDGLLAKIKEIHSTAHDIHFHEVAELRNDLKSNQESWETQHGETSKQVKHLTDKIKELPSKRDCTDLQKHLDGMRKNSLQPVNQNTETVSNLEQRIDNNAAAIRSLERTVEPVLQVPQTISKLEGCFEGHTHAIQSLKIDFQPFIQVPQVIANIEGCLGTHATSLRSLEERLKNTLSDDLVARMARTMHEMYPTIGQLTQQLKDHRSQMDTKFSTLETENGNSKAEVLRLLADLGKNQEELKRAKAAIETAQASLKAHENAERSQPEASNSQGPQLSPEQLKALEDLTILLQKVTELEGQVEQMNGTIKQHDDELLRRLQQMSDFENSLAVQTNSFTELSEKVDERQGGYEDIAESTKKIDPLSQRVDDHASQLIKVLKEVADLGKTAENRSTFETHDLEQLQSQSNSLEGCKDAALERETNKLNVLQSRLNTLEDSKQAATEREAIETNELDTLRSRLEALERSNQAAAHWDTIDNTVIEELQSRLKELEDLNESSSQLNASLKGGLDPKSDSPPEKTEHEKEMAERMSGYLKRLRTVEDSVKRLVNDAKSPPAANQPPSSRQSSASHQLPDSNQPPDQRIEKRDAPQPAQYGRSVTSSKPLRLAPTSSTPFPKGPPPAHYQQMQNPAQSPVISSNAKKERRRKSRTPSAPTTSGLAGEFAKPRQVENLIGKRRRESDGNDSERSNSDSSVVPASPAASSPAASVSLDTTIAPSRKERKLARKKAKQEGIEKAARKATKKRKTH
jgi:chromosome segregation ATPase